MISKNISKNTEFDDLIIYTATCGCLSDKHTQTLTIQKDFNNISLVISSNIHAQYYHNFSKSKLYNIYCEFKYRLINIIKLLCNGYIEANNEFIFSDKESIETYINALNIALKKLDEEVDHV